MWDNLRMQIIPRALCRLLTMSTRETHELSYQIAYSRSPSLNSNFLRLSVVTLMEYLVAMIIISQHKGITNEISMYLSTVRTHPMSLIKFQSSKILSERLCVGSSSSSSRMKEYNHNKLSLCCFVWLFNSH